MTRQNNLNSLTTSIPTPIGVLGLELKAGLLTQLNFLASPQNQSIDNTDSIDNSFNPLIQEIQNYFSGKLTQFKSHFIATGTPFQQKVWHRLLAIPYGQTLTYGQLAKELNTSPRAVGNACRRNPIPLLIPCHRVVGSKGLGGYAGDTTGELFSIKPWLLAHETRFMNSKD